MLEDLGAFFTDFSTPAVFAGVEVQVIFDQPFADPFGPVADATQPQCWAPSAAVQHAHQGSAVVLQGQHYTVERIEPDGTGVSRITLFPA